MQIRPSNSMLEHSRTSKRSSHPKSPHSCSRIPQVQEVGSTLKAAMRTRYWIWNSLNPKVRWRWRVLWWGKGIPRGRSISRVWLGWLTELITTITMPCITTKKPNQIPIAVRPLIPWTQIFIPPAHGWPLSQQKKPQIFRSQSNHPRLQNSRSSQPSFRS